MQIFSFLALLVFLINSGQTHKHTHTHTSNNRVLIVRALRSRSLRDGNSLTKAASRPLFVRTRPLRGLACIMYYNTRRFAPRFLISYMYCIKLYSIGKSVSFASHSIIPNKHIVIDLHLLFIQRNTRLLIIVTLCK